jgi:tRNA/rRNA methyltransferase
MPEIKVVLVHPQNEGNLGAVARAMMNFGLKELHLVAPECEVGLEARRRAMHADKIIDGARVHKSLEQALAGADMVVGTSGVKTSNEKKYPRITATPREFAEKAKGFDGAIALLFGQEDFGLDAEAVKRCDMLVSIPTSADYPIMNISHAASVVFYELFVEGAEVWRSRNAGKMEIERLVTQFQRLLRETGYPEHKREKTTVMFRRIIGRAVLSKWEYHTTMGVLKQSLNRARPRSAVKKRKSAKRN